MATLSSWFERRGPLAALGNAGAVANAARACAEPRAAEAAADAALERMARTQADADDHRASRHQDRRSA